MSDDEYAKVKSLIETLAFLTDSLEHQTYSAKRLREMLFGPSSEKTKKVLEDASNEASKKDEGEQQAPAPVQDAEVQDTEKERPKGHGRNGAQAYEGAERQAVSHPDLKPKDKCPECKRGKVYPLPPAVLVRLRGQPPVNGTVYECERLRCNVCQAIFTAPAPEGVGSETYDETSKSMIALLKYGCGMPFNRLDKLQADLKIPVPTSTQWDLVNQVGQIGEAPYEALLTEAAQGEVVYNDDTGMQVLSIMKENQEHHNRGDPLERTGSFTTGIVSTKKGRRIALFFTGRKHAGENLEQLLARRRLKKPPLQMCDGSDRNLPSELKTIVSNCLAHGRRKFVDLAEAFPEEVRHVLTELGKVYQHDKEAKDRKLTPRERLRFHQANSKSVMDALNKWLEDLLNEKQVEPNSTLGKAIRYMLKRWKRLTRFLRSPGAPLDNNLCERVLKMSILNRKNALFYKTENGARIGDILMSLIATCKLEKVNPMEYLNELQRHKADVKRTPSAWLPWNYPQPTPQP